MLAQNFKAADDLSLNETEYRALITVLGMLERDEIPFGEDGQWFNGKVVQEPVGFNMYHVYSAAPCGTVCCLAGWTECIARVPPYSLFEKRRNDVGLEALFDPYFGDGFSIDRITPAQAAIALRGFLTTGMPDWMTAIGRDPV